MTTKVDNKKEFEKIWNLFEDEVISRFGRTKDGKPNFSEFAKFYEKRNSDDTEKNDYKKVYDKLTKMSNRKNSITIIRNGTIEKIQEYYKILKDDYFIQELLDDETPEHWFD